MIKKIFFLAITNVLAISLSAQNIKLTQTKSADDVKVTNGKYIMFFKKSDIIAAITEIEKAAKTSYANIATSIKNNKLKAVDFQSSLGADKPFIELLKSNLGAFLLSRGKATIFLLSKQIKEIAPDESPEMQELDGSSKVVIFFSEPNVETPIFLGDLQTPLKVPSK